MSVLLEVVIGAILTAFMTAGEIKEEHSIEELQPKRVIETTLSVECKEDN